VLYSEGRSSGLKSKFPPGAVHEQGCRLCSGILENKEAMADEKNTFDRSDDSSEPYKGGQKNAYQAA